ncbi:MAG: leucine-rich repeat protein [Ruminococcus sp.]|jgi:hypothetical protein|nr:leucine-rich repeat protein [Ruminococcus sp.]
MKKIFSMFVSLVMVLTMCPVIDISSYNEDFQAGVLTYTVRIDGTFKITYCETGATKKEIEQSFAELEESNLTVTSIGDYIYDDFLKVSAEIPDTVTEIGAFGCGCRTEREFEEVYDSNGNLIDDVLVSEVTIPCGITDITFPEGVASIGDMGFNSCTSVTSVTFPDSVTSIGYTAFRLCENLTSVTFPDSVDSIGVMGFDSCKNLTYANIPDGVTTIDWAAFSHCTSLTSVDIPDSVITIDSYAFWECPITSINIPEGVTTIEWGAFMSTELSSLTVPASVVYYGGGTFPQTYTSLYGLAAPVWYKDIGPSVTFLGNNTKICHDHGAGIYVVNDELFEGRYDGWYNPGDGLIDTGRDDGIYGTLYGGENAKEFAISHHWKYGGPAPGGSSGGVTPSPSEPPTDDTEKAVELGLTKEQFESPFNGQKAEITIPESVPGFGGEIISLSLEDLNGLSVTFQVIAEEDGKTTVIVGYGAEEEECEDPDDFEAYIEQLADKLEELNKILSGEEDEDEMISGNGALKLVFDEKGDLESCIGSFNVALNASWDFDGTVWVPTPIVISIPVYMEAGVSLGAELSGEVGYDFTNNQITADSGLDLAATGEVTLMLGLGVSMLNAGVYGSLAANADYAILPEPYIKEWGISGQMGLKAKALMFESKVVLCDGNFFKYTQGGPDEEGKWEVGFSKELEKKLNNVQSFQTIQRQFLAGNPDKINSNNYLLVDNAYSYIKPQIATYNGKTIMVYADVDTTRTVYNQQRLYYRVLNSTGWSAPSPVDNNKTFDGEFSVKTGSDGIYIAYEEGKRLFTSDDDITDVASQIEISTAKWNGSAFTNFKTITDNSVYDFSPKVVIDNDDVNTAYLTNSNNNVLANDTANSLNMYNAWRESSDYLISESNMIVNYDFCGTDWVALIDSDNDYETSQTDLYYNDSYGVVASGNFTDVEASTVGYGFFLANNGYLATFEGSDTVNTTDTYVGNAIAFNNLDSKATISYVVPSETGTSLCYVQYVGGKITKSTKLVNSVNYIDSYDLYFSNGIKTAYLETFVNLTDDIETYSEFLTTDSVDPNSTTEPTEPTEPSDVTTEPAVTTEPSSSTTKSSSATTKSSSATTKSSSVTTKSSSATTKSSSVTTEPGNVVTNPSNVTDNSGNVVTNSSNVYTNPTENPEFVPGDFNGDNEIGITDIITVAKILHNQITLPAEILIAADLNSDSIVNSIDLSIIKFLLLKKS